MKTAALGERAFAHVYALAANIGPRPAGSAAERAAFDYVADQLRAWGYTVEVSPAPFAPVPRLNWLSLSGGLALVLGGLALPSAPALAVLAPLWIAALPDLGREILHRRRRTALSQNLVAYTSALEAAPTLIFCAHVDTAPASVFGARALLWLHSRLAFLGLRMAWLLAAGAALQWLGWALPEWMAALLTGGALGLGVVWMGMEALNQLRPGGGGHAPGAHDNASGVGALLAAAEHFAAQPPERQRLGFLFTGAEETGLHGAEAFAQALTAPRAAVLAVDMVGAGDALRYITQDGALRPRATTAALNDVLRAAVPEARGLAYPLRSGDHLPFLRRGQAASALQTSGSAEAELAYHTVHDTVDVIDIAALGRTAQALVAIVREAEARGYPEAA